MAWTPHIAIRPIAPPPDLFDLTTATGHPVGGLNLLLPSGGDYIYFSYGSEVHKFAGLNQITTRSFAPDGVPQPAAYNADMWHIPVRDAGGGVDPGGIGEGNYQKGTGYHAPDNTSIEWGRNVTAPASRSNSTLNFWVYNFGGDMRVRASLSDGSAALARYTLPRESDCCFAVDFAAAGAGQTLSVDVYCASRVSNVYEETRWKAVWMPPPEPPPLPRGWQNLQLLIGAMGDGRGSL